MLIMTSQLNSDGRYAVRSATTDTLVKQTHLFTHRQAESRKLPPKCPLAPASVQVGAPNRNVWIPTDALARKYTPAGSRVQHA